MKKFLVAFFLVILKIGGFTAWHYYTMISSSNVEVSKNSDGYLYIPTGSSFNDVLESLNKNGYIENMSSFEWVSTQKKYVKNVKPGKYKLKNGMSNNELVNMLRIGDQVHVNVTFNNVRTIESLAGKVSKNIEADSLSLITYFKSNKISRYGFNHKTILALFIPDTYEFKWNTSNEEFVKKMAKEFKSFWTQERINKAKKLNLSQSEVSTLASIVEAETKKKDEMPKVAGLYINRIRKRMKLQSDPTVKFAIGNHSKKRIYLRDLKVDSPYNTYKYIGLPPGPIACPSKIALKAVLNYTKHQYIYMCAQPNYSGYHNFAKSHRQHINNRNKYIQFLRKENIK